MRQFFTFPGAILILFAASVLTGCGDSQPPAGGQAESESGDNGRHAEKGPHGGRLIDLGHEHAFHAELVEDHDAETVSIYILDKNLNEYPISEPKITLSLDIHGASETFELNAAEAVNGKTARFDAADNSLHEELHAHQEAEGKLRVTIDGTPYTGMLKRAGRDEESHKDHEH